MQVRLKLVDRGHKSFISVLGPPPTASHRGRAARRTSNKAGRASAASRHRAAHGMSTSVLEAAKTQCASQFQQTSINGLLPLGAFWQRAALLCERKFPGAAVTATLVRVAILADGVKKTEHEDKLLDVLRSVPEPEGGWDTDCDNYPAGNSSESRATCKAFVSHVLRSADAEPGRLQAIVDRATADAHGPPKGNTPRENGALHIKGNKERDDERVAKARAWQTTHVPAHTPWPAQVMPSRSMLLLFSEWSTNATAPEIKQLSEYIKAGRAQTQPAGRPTCRLQDMISILLAMATMYSGPCPDGCRVDPKVDTTMLEWDDGAPGGPSVVVKRPAALSFGVVAEAIATLTVALSPLSEKQKEEHSEKIWNQVINEAATLGGRTLSHALSNAMKSRAVDNALQESAPRSTHRQSEAGKGGGPRPGKKGARREESPRADRDRDAKKAAKAGRDACPDWEDEGKCRAHAEGKCKDFRHPESWRGVGKAGARK